MMGNYNTGGLNAYAMQQPQQQEPQMPEYQQNEALALKNAEIADTLADKRLAQREQIKAQAAQEIQQQQYRDDQTRAAMNASRQYGNQEGYALGSEDMARKIAGMRPMMVN